MKFLNKSLVGLLLLIFVLCIINNSESEGLMVGPCTGRCCHYGGCPKPAPPPPVLCTNYKCPPYYTKNSSRQCCAQGPCNCTQAQCCSKISLSKTPDLHNMKYVGAGCCRFTSGNKSTVSAGKGYKSPAQAVADCSKDKKCKGVDLARPKSSQSGDTYFHNSDSWPTSHGMGCGNKDHLCYRKTPTCEYSGSQPKSTGWRCLTVDETCTRPGNPSLLGAVQISKSAPNYWQEIAAICDKSPGCRYVQYDGKTATYFKEGGCPAGQRAVKKGLDVWERPGGSAKGGGSKTKYVFPAHKQKATSGLEGSGSKGTVTAAQGKLVVPYGFGVDEKICQKYCDDEQGCSAIHWESGKGGQPSKCFLRGGPVDPKKFSKEKFTNQGGFIKFDQNMIKYFLGNK